MNGESASACLGTSIQEVNGRATDSELAGNPRRAASAGIFQPGTEPADRREAWRLSPLGAQTLGKEIRWNGESITVLSHELRNSLGAIRSAAGILWMETSAGPAAVKARSVIERQVGQMTRLTQDLLDLSRMQRGQLSLQLELIDLRTVVNQSMQTVEHIMRERNHRLTTSIPDAPLWLHGDGARLEHAFVNLLINAAKYTDAGGEVGLAVERKAGEAIVRIRDTGIGIAPELLPTVFDLFVQADHAQRRADAGLGIGLALVRSLVESHGGSVAAASAGLREGSEFTVRLPIPAQWR
jgi:signal transduction histidine kinase